MSPAPSNSMRYQRGPEPPPPSRRPTLNPEAPSYPAPTTTMWVDTNQTVLLQTAQAVIFNPGSPHISFEARIVLDTGSQRSYITDHAKTKLSLTSDGEQRMSIMTFGSSEERPHVCDTVRVGVVMRDRQPKQLALCTVPHICEPLASQPINFCRDNYEHLSGLDLADSSDGSSRLKIDILIGSDQYWDLITGRTLRGSSGPIAIDTGIGWVLSGPVSLLTQEQAMAGLVVTHALRVDSQLQEEETLDSRLKSFWELESLGITEPERSVHDKFGDTIRFKDGRYEVALPWKDPHPTLPDNYKLSLKRLQGLLRRLQHDQGVLQEYNTIIRNQIQQGIVEVVEHHDHSENEKIHYLPHHAVIRQDKETTKLSCKSKWPITQRLPTRWS